MSGERRWSLVPTSQGRCIVFLLAGIVLAIVSAWKMAAMDETTASIIASVIGAVGGIAMVGVAVIGLVSPRLRGR